MAGIHRHYTEKKPYAGLIVVAGMLVGAAAIVVKVPPGTWWVEGGVILLVSGGIFVLATWITGRKKWGAVVSVGLIGLVLLKRWDLLDPYVFGAWLIILGIISLFN